MKMNGNLKKIKCKIRETLRISNAFVKIEKLKYFGSRR